MDLGPCLEYIRKSFERFKFFQPNDHDDIVGLPNPFIAPNDKLFAKQQFYWDSYFIIRGLLIMGDEYVELAKGMVDNFIYLFKRFKHIPAANLFSSMGVSQLPFLTSMGLEIYERTHDKEWLRNVGETASRELRDYWENDNHKVGVLSRLYGHGTHISAELESGWDFTSRFGNTALNYLPVDLNSLLYKYEVDLFKIWREIGERTRAKEYKRRAEAKAEKIKELMFDCEEGFFFDYDFTTGKRRRFYSVAGFYPMWVGLLDKKKAKSVRDAGLEVLESPGGVANTQAHDLARNKICQHDFPNGWPHQQLIVVEGLDKYGFSEDAQRIAEKWINTNVKVFEKTGKLWEKYDVVSIDIGKPGLYPTQPGFGWTNAVFLVLWEKYGS